MDPSIVCKEETVETSSGEDGQKEGKIDKLLNKYCAVCGDKALGYNFNALTCESCKAFFRRNALKNKEFKCPFSNKCEVTLVTRRFCQKCRLKKCFDIGMKKEWILSDEEKQQKRQKIEQNRAKKRQDVPDLSPGAFLAAASPSTLPHNRDVVSPASTSISFPLGTDSIGLERPQARVLPSSRPPSEDDNQPRQKQMRYEIPDESNTRLGLADPYSSNDSSEQCALIRHELTSSNSPPQNSTFIPTIHDRSQINMLNFVVQQPQLSAHSSSKDLPLDATVNQSSLTRMSPDLTTLPEQVNPMNLDVKNEQSPQSYPSTSCGQNPFSPHMGGIPLVGAMTEIKSSDSSLSFPDITNTSFDNLDDIVTVAIEAEFHVQNIHSPMHSLTGKSLNDRETDRLHELFMASRSLVEPLDLEKSPFSNADPKNLISVVNLTDLAIKRIIRMAKKINPFITMCQEDQIALLKGGCTELMILRSVINYNPDKNSWRIPSKDRPREVNMELLKEASHLGVNLYEEHQRFVKSFDPKWRTDENVMLLLSAIALFNPARTNVLHKDVVKLEQDAYYYLLRRYLETICTGCDARRAYLHLIGRLKDLNRLNESHIQLFLGLNPKLVEPLLIEIFDLKPTP
ncbi:nuclear hormone receptor HR96-like [Tigriopus californicus]|uniref:nuclear hormone receptor HR96-like n=1 Tax=Tigriopus californicus TaxID=6832 RepID=UPI0027DA2387|nr:nuclear hormone receptor HR96-like [Tigriopus californicus]